MADYELVKEVMVSLGEQLSDIGLDGPMETIDGHGEIGKACRNCRYAKDAKIIAFYMKDLAKTIAKLPPSPQKQQAVEYVKQAWENLKIAWNDDEDEDDSPSRPPHPAKPIKVTPELIRKAQAVGRLTPAQAAEWMKKIGK
jgi:hypothetical protein